MFASVLATLRNQWSELTPVAKGSAIAVGGILLVATILRRRRNRRVALHKSDFQRDVVYLYQFPSCRTIVTVSPYALKLETWLRWQNIPYKSIRGTKRWSKHGQIPFVELNGEQIADSNIIIQTLQKKFDRQDEGLSAEEQSITRAVAMMIENQTVMSYFYYRYVEDAVKFLATWEFIRPMFRFVISRSFPKEFRKRALNHGIGKHDVEDIYKFGIEDFQAVSNLLGDKKYFFGDNMTTLDCYLFGHLCQVLYIPVNYPHTAYIRKNCQNLVEYTSRIKNEFWPDWDTVCAEHLFDS